MKRRPRRRSPARVVRPGDLPSRFIAFFDGCCEPTNPRGHVGWACVVMEGDREVHALSGYLEPSAATSNNVAEYMAVLACLDWFIANHHTPESIILFGDSQLVINQLFGRWKIRGGPEDPEHKEGIYAPLARAAKQKVALFGRLHGFWIPRTENERADDLSKEQLRQRGVEFRIQPEEA